MASQELKRILGRGFSVAVCVGTIIGLGILRTPGEIAATVSLVLLCFFVVPLIDILWMVRRGKTATPDVPNREARTEPFTVAIISGSAAVLIIRAMGMHGEPIIHAILITYIINIILVMGVIVGAMILSVMLAITSINQMGM